MPPSPQSTAVTDVYKEAIAAPVGMILMELSPSCSGLKKKNKLTDAIPITLQDSLCF